MPCYSPLRAYVEHGKKTDNGKKSIVFKKPKLYKEEINLPCGQCMGCRLLRSSIWAVRCMHEASLHDDNCFITLTYDDEHLPDDYSLRKHHFQDFLKRLRKDIYPIKIRYFMCGEYGEESWRPHYHAILFGYDFPDKIRVQNKETENPYYLSSQLTKLWPKGNHLIADCTYETAAYVARYCTKKITGEKADYHYHRTIIDWNEFTGEIHHYSEVDLVPEYSTMSKRPAIGKEWYDKFKQDCYPSDYLIQDGRKVPVPKYYDKLFEAENEEEFRVQKIRRDIKFIKYSEKYKEETHLLRLRVKEDIKLKNTENLKRNKQ